MNVDWRENAGWCIRLLFRADAPVSRNSGCCSATNASAGLDAQWECPAWFGRNTASLELDSATRGERLWRFLFEVSCAGVCAKLCAGYGVKGAESGRCCSLHNTDERVSVLHFPQIPCSSKWIACVRAAFALLGGLPGEKRSLGPSVTRLPDCGWDKALTCV